MHGTGMKQRPFRGQAIDDRLAILALISFATFDSVQPSKRIHLLRLAMPPSVPFYEVLQT